LRSILYDILRQRPELARHTFPDRWAMSSECWVGHLGPCSRSDLLCAFRYLAMHIQDSAKVCLFIDGLDEYEGDHDELIQAVREMASIPNVKLCIASGPWNVFEAAFGSSPLQKVYLQDVNKADVQLYVKNKLEDRSDFARLRRLDGQAEELVDELINKAKGVFLWVYLVVRSLIRGLENFERISDMQRRLRSFPDDLDELFSRMLNSLDPIYRRQSARAFQIALSACRPLSLLGYWFADVEEENHDFALRLPVQALELEEFYFRHEGISKRLNARSNGLLEVSVMPDESEQFKMRMDFLHRTGQGFSLNQSRSTIAFSVDPKRL
jgi:hypothetical protein